MGNTMVEVRAFVTINDENENDFQEVQKSRSSKKKEKISNNSPPLAPTPPSQSLGIYLKISPRTAFEINKTTLIRVAILN